jgi:hypothetical protein
MESGLPVQTHSDGLAKTRFLLNNTPLPVSRQNNSAKIINTTTTANVFPSAAAGFYQQFINTSSHDLFKFRNFSCCPLAVPFLSPCWFLAETLLKSARNST